MPPKRTDPQKVARQRVEIAKDIERRSNVPQAQRQYPNALERGRRVVTGAVKAVDTAIKQAADANREKYEKKKLEYRYGKGAVNVPGPPANAKPQSSYGKKMDRLRKSTPV